MATSLRNFAPEIVYSNSKVYHLVIEKCTTFQLLCKGTFN